jgi:hypothetical protein
MPSTRISCVYSRRCLLLAVQSSNTFLSACGSSCKIIPSLFPMLVCPRHLGNVLVGPMLWIRGVIHSHFFRLLAIYSDLSVSFPTVKWTFSFISFIFFQHHSHSPSFESGAYLGELDYFPWAIKINLSRKLPSDSVRPSNMGRNFRAALSLWTRENFLSAWYSLSDSGWPLWWASDCRVEGVGYLVSCNWDIDRATKNWRCLHHRPQMEASAHPCALS